MRQNHSEGLGLSLVLFFGVMLCGLAVIAAPIYWVNSPTVYPNAQTAPAQEPGGPAYTDHARSRFPLAVLQHKPIVDATALTELDAKHAQPQHKVAQASQHKPRTMRRAYAQVPDETQPQQPANRGFFSLF